MGRASALLSGRRRAVAFVVLTAVLACYYGWSSSLWNASTWWDVAWLALVLVPAVFGLVYLALPIRTRPWILPVGVLLIPVVWGLEEANLHALADFGKLAAASLLGFWFIGVFESLGLVVFVALVIPWIDAYSVWRGPTKKIGRAHV